MRKLCLVMLALCLVLFSGIMISCANGGGGGGNDDAGGNDDGSEDYLCFTANADGSSICLSLVGTIDPLPELVYSRDGENWEDFTLNETVVDLDKGEKVYLRAKGINSTFSKDPFNYIFFGMEGSIAASGNIMSLLDSSCQSKKIPCDYCFYQLFFLCRSLTSAPSLPATTLKKYCYNMMFQSCDGLTVAPKLPATTLADNCYNSMFYQCYGLTVAPELPAKTLVKSCYNYMFYRCMNLNYVKVGFTDWKDSDVATSYWLEDVASEGTFECSEGLDTITYIDASHVPEGWTVFNHDTAGDSLCFTACTAGSSITTTVVGTIPALPELEYSVDGGSRWKDFIVGTTKIDLNNGNKVYLRAKDTNSTFSKNFGNYIKFVMTGKMAASGNIMSLLDSSCKSKAITGAYCFRALFEGCSSLTEAPEMPAETLSQGCYDSMFAGCTGLEVAPELPATKLSEGCYFGMFSGCSKLTEAPELPAKSLVSMCYASMFQSCSSLAYVNVEFTDWKASVDATDGWLSGVAASGTFICPDGLDTSIRNANRIPSGWTELKDLLCFTAGAAGSWISTAVEGKIDSLPQLEYSDDGKKWTEFVINKTKIDLDEGDKVYLKAKGTNSTFSKNDSNYIKFVMAGKIAASGNIMSLVDSTGQSKVIPCDYCFYKLFYNCNILTSAPELPATTLVNRCYSHMFEGCGSLTEAPELPAKTLVNNCYSFMFYYCMTLNYVKVGFTDWNESVDPTLRWSDGISSKGTFVCPAGLAEKRSANNIPTGWTVVHP